jgi:hypothetical protein
MDFPRNIFLQKVGRNGKFGGISLHIYAGRFHPSYTLANFFSKFPYIISGKFNWGNALKFQKILITH